MKQPERQELRVLEMNRFEHGIVVNALNELRNELLEKNCPTGAVDEVLLKAIDARPKKEKQNAAR